MKNIAAKYILSIVLHMIVTAVYAYNFKIGGIYYKITSDTEKTCMVTWGTSNVNSYSGKIAIPSSVTYNSTKYNVTAIDTYTFYRCSNLSQVEIPASVKTINSYAFGYCDALISIIDLATSPQSVSSTTFYNTNTKIHVPYGYDNAYKISNYWKAQSVIGDMINYTLGDVDNNGFVNVKDAEFLDNYILGKKQTLYNTYATDINGDNIIDIVDLVCLIGILNNTYRTTNTDIVVDGGDSVIPSWGHSGNNPGQPEEGETEF